MKPAQKFKYKTYLLKNKNTELTFLPEYGCYWTSLRFKIKGEWLDFLVTIPNSDELIREPFGSFTMAPWVNRIQNAQFRFANQEYVLRSNFPDNSAIHGDVRHRSWDVIKSTDFHFEASLDTQNYFDFNYPFRLVFVHSMELFENQLQVTLHIKNLDSKLAPVGLGFHPFFKRTLTDWDKDVSLYMPAQKIYPDTKQIPMGCAEPVTHPNDFTQGRTVGNPNLDHCFTELSEQRMELVYSGTQVRLEMTMDPIFNHVVIYAPNDLDGNPKNCIAIEPQTHVNNGFNFYDQGWKRTGVKILEPGETWGGSIRIAFKRNIFS